MTTENHAHEQPDPVAAPPAVAPPEPNVVPPAEASEPALPPEELQQSQETGEVAEESEEESAGSEEEAAEGETTDGEAPVVPSNLAWYVVKVQSNREESIKEAIERRVKIEGLQDSFGQVVIPTEKVSEMRKNKRYIKERKLLPGYLMVQVEFNDRMLYLFRETSGVGDFVGAGLGKKPIPMSEKEIKKWIGGPAEGGVEVSAPDVSPFNEGDRVKVKDGMFAGMEGVVKTVLIAKGAITVELTIFGRPVPVELEYWQVEFA